MAQAKKDQRLKFAVTTYIHLSDGSYLASSDNSYLALLPDSTSADYDALYAQWLKEGMPVNFKYNAVIYRVTTEPDIEFVAVARGANPERADENHLWDGLYGPYGRIWRAAGIPQSTFTTLTFDDGSVMTFNNGSTLEMKG